MYEMSDEDLRPAIEANEAACFSTLRALGNTVEVREHKTWTHITTGVPFWMFNGIHRVRVDEPSALSCVGSWVGHFKEKKLPFGVFLYPQSQSAKLTDALVQHGLKGQPEGTMVVFDSNGLGDFQPGPLPNEYQLIQIRSADQYAHFAKTFAQVFAMPDTLLSALKDWALGYGFDESLPMQNIAILREGAAVAIASYHLHADVAGIFNVGVHPDHRLRGLGLKVTRAIAELARDRGIRYLVGGGTPEGMNVYRKAKIREIGKSQRWIFNVT